MGTRIGGGLPRPPKLPHGRPVVRSAVELVWAGGTAGAMACVGARRLLSAGVSRMRLRGSLLSQGPRNRL